MFDRVAIKARAKQILNLNLGHLIAAWALAVFLPSFLSGGGNGFTSGIVNPANPAIGNGSAAWDNLWPILVIIFIIIFFIALALGLLLSCISIIGQAAFDRVSLMAYDGVDVQVRDLLGIKGYWLKLLGLYLWMGLRIFLWSLLFIIPGIIAAYRYALAPYLMFEDPSKGINQVIDESASLMRGFKGELFIFDLSFIGWWILTAVTFGIAGFWVGPYYAISRAGAYRAIRYLATARQQAVAAPTVAAVDSSVVTETVGAETIDASIVEQVVEEPIVEEVVAESI